MPPLQLPVMLPLCSVNVLMHQLHISRDRHELLLLLPVPLGGKLLLACITVRIPRFSLKLPSNGSSYAQPRGLYTEVIRTADQPPREVVKVCCKSFHNLIRLLCRNSFIVIARVKMSSKLCPVLFYYLLHTHKRLRYIIIVICQHR